MPKKKKNAKAAVNGTDKSELEKTLTTAEEDDYLMADLVQQTQRLLAKYPNPYTIEQLALELLALCVGLADNDEMISALVYCIFENFIYRNDGSETFGKLIKVLCNTSHFALSKKFRKHFLDNCQREFQGGSGCRHYINALEKKLDVAAAISNLSETNNALKSRIRIKRREARQRQTNNIRFIGQLFKRQLVTLKIIIDIVGILLEYDDEESLENLCVLLSVVGKDMTKKLAKFDAKNSAAETSRPFDAFIPPKNFMIQIFDKLKTAFASPTISIDLKAAISELLELQQSGWIPRSQASSDKGPESPGSELQDNKNLNSDGERPNLSNSQLPSSLSSNSQLQMETISQSPSALTPKRVDDWTGPREAGLFLFRFPDYKNLEYLLLTNNCETWFPIQGRVETQSGHLVTAKRQACTRLGLTDHDYELVPGCSVQFEYKSKRKSGTVVCWSARLNNANMNIQPIAKNLKFQWFDYEKAFATLKQSPDMQKALKELNEFLNLHQSEES